MSAKAQTCAGTGCRGMSHTDPPSSAESPVRAKEAGVTQTPAVMGLGEKGGGTVCALHPAPDRAVGVLGRNSVCFRLEGLLQVSLKWRGRGWGAQRGTVSQGEAAACAKAQTLAWDRVSMC